MAANIVKIVQCSILLLIAAVKFRECCVCEPIHPQRLYCSSDFVIRVKIISTPKVWVQDFYGMKIDRKMYEVEILEYFKGKDIIPTLNNTYLSDAKAGRKYVHAYHAHSHCGTHVENATEYLLAGQIRKNDHLHINSCHLKQLWKNVTKETIFGMNGGYDCYCNERKCNKCMRESKPVCMFTLPNRNATDKTAVRYCTCSGEKQDYRFKWACKEEIKKTKEENEDKGEGLDDGNDEKDGADEGKDQMKTDKGKLKDGESDDKDNVKCETKENKDNKKDKEKKDNTKDKENKDNKDKENKDDTKDKENKENKDKENKDNTKDKENKDNKDKENKDNTKDKENKDNTNDKENKDNTNDKENKDTKKDEDNTKDKENKDNKKDKEEGTDEGEDQQDGTN